VHDPPQRIASQGGCRDGSESLKYDHPRLDIDSYEGTLHGTSMNSEHPFVTDDGDRKPEKSSGDGAPVITDEIVGD
jgi:hypothetical protein